MDKLKIVKKLRDGENLNLFDKNKKLFVRIQLNKQEQRVCWERWVSRDRKGWVNWNYYLDIKSVLQVVEEINQQK